MNYPERKILRKVREAADERGSLIIVLPFSPYLINLKLQQGQCLKWNEGTTKTGRVLLYGQWLK